MQHNGQECTDINIESKDGQRRLLCCNKVGTRCPSLGYDMDKLSFTTNEIENFTEFAKTLKRIHVRLIMEGYKIENGRIVKPNFDSNEYKFNKSQ